MLAGLIVTTLPVLTQVSTLQKTLKQFETDQLRESRCHPTLCCNEHQALPTLPSPLFQQQTTQNRKQWGNNDAIINIHVTIIFAGNTYTLDCLLVVAKLFMKVEVNRIFTNLRAIILLLKFYLLSMFYIKDLIIDLSDQV